MKIKYKKIKICILGPFFLDDLLKRKHNNSFRALGMKGAPYLSNIARSINVKNIGKIKAYFCQERAHHYCKESGFTAGMLKSALTEGHSEK